MSHSSTTLYYKVARRSTTLYYKVLRQYYSSTTLYYKVLLEYYSVLQSTTPVLLCTTPVLLQYYSGATLKRHLLLRGALQESPSTSP